MGKTATIDVYINGEQAKARLSEIKDELRDVKVLRDKAAAEGDVKGFNQLNTEMKKLNTEARKLEKSTTDVNAVLKDISSASINELHAALRQATSEMNKMKRTDPGYEDQQKKVSTLRGELDKTTGKMREHESTAKQSYSKIAGYVAIAAAAVYSFARGIGQAIEMYKEQEKAEKKVEQGIKATGGAAGLSLKELREEASKLQSETIIGDETILNDVTAQLLTFTNLAGNNFKRAQLAAMDLATVLDGDLKGSSILLGKALNDPAQGLTYLRRVGIAFTDSQISTIKSLAETNHLAEAQTLILDELAKQYGGQAKAAAAGAGALDQARNVMSDFGETVGKYLVYSIIPFANGISKITKSLNDWLSVPISEEMSQEREKVNTLTTAILDKNISLEQRNRLYTELKT